MTEIAELEQQLAEAKKRLAVAIKALAPKHKGGEMEEYRSANTLVLTLEREVAAAKACPDTKPHRRLFQFSLRTLLILIAVVACLAFAWMKTIEPYRLQWEAIAVITKLGGTFKTEDATGWVRYLDTKAQDVVVVDLADCDKPDEYLPHLARLPKLRSLVIGGHSVGDEQVAALGRVASLRGLMLDSTLVSQETVQRLKDALPNLLVYRCERRDVFGTTTGVDFGGDSWIDDDTVPEWLRSEYGNYWYRVRRFPD